MGFCFSSRATSHYSQVTYFLKPCFDNNFILPQCIEEINNPLVLFLCKIHNFHSIVYMTYYRIPIYFCT